MQISICFNTEVMILDTKKVLQHVVTTNIMIQGVIVYIARWTSVISEEVCDMGSYRTRRQPSVIRAHITHFFTYHTSPRVIYSLYHNNCPICLLFIEVLPKMSIKPSKTHEIKTWKITKYFCSVISYFGKTYHTLPQCDLDSQSGISRYIFQILQIFSCCHHDL